MVFKYMFLIMLLFYLPYETFQHEVQDSKRAQYKEAVEAIDAITVRLEALIKNKNEEPRNFLVSPLSAAIVIGQLMLGAEGEFREELDNLLSLPNKNYNHNVTTINLQSGALSESIPHGLLHLQLGSLMRKFKKITDNSSFTLEMSNGVFYNNPIKLKEKFRGTLMNLYNSELIPVNFTTEPGICQKTINEWGASHTNGLIKNILSEPAPTTTSSIFANAIYFKGNWKYPFIDKLNTIAPFNTTTNSSVNATYMRYSLEEILYVESKKHKCKMISLPYEDDDLGLYIILPNADHENAYNINAFSQNLKASDILEMIKDAKYHDVFVHIPKMTLTTTMSILEPLKKYSNYIKNKKVETPRSERISFGNRAFSNSLDELEEKVDDFVKYNNTDTLEDIILTNAAENDVLKISNLFQQMTFSINEKGTESAVITGGIIDYIYTTKQFNLNRPFVFFVRHEETTATIFWGTIADPTQTS